MAGAERGHHQRQVEEVKDRPPVDLVRSQSILEEARISLARNRASVEAAWRQLAAEVGVPSLPLPVAPASAAILCRAGTSARAERILAANTDLKQAAAETERARLELERPEPRRCRT